MSEPRHAFDRASVRRIDQDGHLYVEVANISAANVCPYRGSEIPGADRLGLDPNRIYQLLRDPGELAKAAPTFAGKPVMAMHRPVSAEDHPHEVVVGAVGEDVRFEPPFLKAPLSIWDGEAIDGIESGTKRALSCGYRYDADMTPGVQDGVRYDGIMRNIIGNHLALVMEGRAGPAVIVGDSSEGISMTRLTRKAAVVQGALAAYLRPKLAQDQKIDMTPALADVTARNFAARKPAIVAALKTQTMGKLAQDADLDDVVELLEAIGEITPAEEEEAEDKAAKDKAKDTKAKDTKAKVKGADKRDDDDNDDDEKKDEDEDDDDKKRRAAQASDKGKQAADTAGLVTKQAMDAAISAAVQSATDAAVRAHRDLREAERVVRPYVGELAMAHDSAEAVYRTALTSLGAKLDGVPAAAFPAILAAYPVPGAAKAAAPIAMDSAGAKKFSERFPNANRLLVR